MPTTFHRLRKVLEKTGHTKTILYNLIREGKFPAPIPLTTRTVVWVSDEVDAWITDHLAEVRKRQAAAKKHQPAVQNQDGEQ